MAAVALDALLEHRDRIGPGQDVQRRLRRIDQLQHRVGEHDASWSSQFSREYARLFGAPPRKHLERLLADEGALVE